jgi:hypothetical protein
VEFSERSKHYNAKSQISENAYPGSKGEWTVIKFLNHWLWQDLYNPVWPNLVASLIVGVWVDVRAKLRHKELTKTKE